MAKTFEWSAEIAHKQQVEYSWRCHTSHLEHVRKEQQWKKQREQYLKTPEGLEELRLLREQQAQKEFQQQQESQERELKLKIYHLSNYETSYRRSYESEEAKESIELVKEKKQIEAEQQRIETEQREAAWKLYYDHQKFLDDVSRDRYMIQQEFFTELGGKTRDIWRDVAPYVDSLDLIEDDRGGFMKYIHQFAWSHVSDFKKRELACDIKERELMYDKYEVTLWREFTLFSQVSQELHSASKAIIADSILDEILSKSEVVPLGEVLSNYGVD
jgi:hypothetical protein